MLIVVIFVPTMLSTLCRYANCRYLRSSEPLMMESAATNPPIVQRRSPFMLGVRHALSSCLAGLMMGCVSMGINPVVSVPGAATVFAQVPLRSGWFEGQATHYLTTDVSDQETARKMSANFAPSLAPLWRNPNTRSLVPRVYKFTNSDQGTVFQSAPKPLGFENVDVSYSPLWVLVEVTWVNAREARLLTSEEAVLAAEERLDVVLNNTGIVVNCPILMMGDQTLSETRAIGDLPGWAGRR
jgi:hypothetical protein